MKKQKTAPNTLWAKAGCRAFRQFCSRVHFVGSCLNLDEADKSDQDRYSEI